MNDIPEWAMDEALAIRSEFYKASKVVFDDEIEIIARALVKAKDQGMAECREMLMEQMRRGIAEYQDGPKP